jgi:two-component system cell cycle sensor histidine kinase/response regulator CckA
MAADSPPRVLPQVVLDAMPGAVAQLGPSGDVLGVNADWRALASAGRLMPSTNVTPGVNYLDACEHAAAHGEIAAGHAATAVRMVLDNHRTPAPLEYKLATAGGVLWRELTATRIDGEGYRGALVTHVDITQRKVAAEAARRTESRYRAIVESAPIGIYQTSPDGLILAANQSLAEMAGAPSADALVGTSIIPLYANPSDRLTLLAHVEKMGGSSLEIEWKRLDGSQMWVQVVAHATRDSTGRTLFYEGFIYDISERKRLEAQLLQAQKMESVGRLAGGIAHDFNNLLTVMIGYAEMLHEGDELPASLQPAVREILAAARRAAELTGRMLAFARKQRVQPRAVNVNEVVRGIEGLLRRIIGEDVRLEVRLAPDVAPVIIDPAQLEQVLMNLAVNARDAMPQGGTMTIATDRVDIREDDARRHPGLKPGPQTKITVADTGIGMDEETLARVFEPFFTTKPPGKGTGLGLAMCYGIVKQAGGFIGCESAKGVGTTCTLLLPESEESIAAAASTSYAAAPPRPSVARATILVVEDEPVVRQFVAEVLVAIGHDVHVTGTPHEGLRIASRYEGRLDLLVTDVVMPQMDGVTLATQIRTRQPKVAVVLMSGYQDRTVVTSEIPALLLPKPFTAAQLRDRVEEALKQR